MKGRPPTPGRFGYLVRSPLPELVARTTGRRDITLVALRHKFAELIRDAGLRRRRRRRLAGPVQRYCRLYWYDGRATGGLFSAGALLAMTPGCSG